MSSKKTAVNNVVPLYYGPDVSVVHASGAGILEENPPVAAPSLSPMKPTRRLVTTMVSNDLVVVVVVVELPQAPEDDPQKR